MFRRPRPRPGPLGPARRKLARARELCERGDCRAAADAFEELAQGAEQRGMLDRAGDLRMRVVQCYLKLDSIDRADAEARQALHLYLCARRLRSVSPMCGEAAQRLADVWRGRAKCAACCPR